MLKTQHLQIGMSPIQFSCADKRPMPVDDTPAVPSPLEDYTQFPFHWTGESLKETPKQLGPPHVNRPNKSALIDQFPMIQEPPLSIKEPQSAKPNTRKKRFQQLRRAMSLTNIRHRPTAPDTAPPTPTVPSQIPSSSVAVKSLESLTHWQLPDPTGTQNSNSITWPSNFVLSSTSSLSYPRPRDQLSPPSSIPSESLMSQRRSLVGLGITRSSASLSMSPNSSPVQSPANLYPPTMYDTINLSDSNVLEKDGNGKVVAGTPEGLVAYITSPDCLDYDLLSDFFMMYRKFMEPVKLLGLLCARFEWGLIRGAVVKPPDNEGTVLLNLINIGMVRVRTFAALRHWLLNYFADDFAPSPSLRTQFIKSINSLGRDKRVKSSVRDTRIITELKRCWRRVCAIFWDDHVLPGNQEREITPDVESDRHSFPQRPSPQPNSTKNR
jgi:hypothetical protein